MAAVVLVLVVVEAADLVPAFAFDFVFVLDPRGVPLPLVAAIRPAIPSPFPLALAALLPLLSRKLPLPLLTKLDSATSASASSAASRALFLTKSSGSFNKSSAPLLPPPTKVQLSSSSSEWTDRLPSVVLPGSPLIALAALAWAAFLPALLLIRLLAYSRSR